MRYFLLFIILWLFSATCNAQEKEIRQILNKQVRCWNVGDLDCFMDAYWKSDSLLFIGKNGITEGWYKTYNNYHQNYPADNMGVLNFEILHIQSISEDAYFVVGKWNLIRQTGDNRGHFTLIFRKIEGQWLITTDHSS